ncbi:MAG TPA: ABC transporter permease subunit [Dokdonella sp.]
MSARRYGAAGTWLLAGLSGLCAGGILLLFGFLAGAGLAPFWPAPVDELQLQDGRVLLGEIVASDATGLMDALAIRTSENERMGSAYQRIRLGDIAARSRPADAVAITLVDGRRLYGHRAAQGEAALLAAATSPAEALEILQPNALGLLARCGVFFNRLAHFLATPPAASNLIGGVLPALLGTLTLVLLMSLIVMPFGIATAIYLHRRRGFAARCVRIAINQLAGVPSIVYGVIGLGLFVHGLGGGIDRLFYADRLPVPTFGGGGLLWAALTLALLTLPVVVVSVEEGLARIPGSLREGALALGATHDEALWTLLLPAARPALLTGLILAVARASGAVAPLMLVGVVKLAPALPVDGVFPYLHPSREFMHLGFTIYDAALASADAIRGVPRAYACAGLLVGVVIVLNLTAILLRNRLRDRYRALET